MSGLFLVLEGVDGAGTTTQLERLTRRLTALGHDVHPTREPSTGPIGALLRQLLSGVLARGARLPASPSSPSGAPDWDTMALLFAADRLDHLASEIEPVLARGGVVISDRYDASSIGYQSVTSSGDARALDWIRTLNGHARRPDRVLVLDVSPEEAEARRARRGLAAEMYDAAATQRQLCAFYKELPKHMPGDAITVLDGEGSADEVEARVLAEVTALLASKRGGER